MQNYIYGAGGHGKVVLDAMQMADMTCAGFVDDKEIANLAGIKLFKRADLALDGTVSLHLAIGNCITRETLAAQLSKAQFFSVIHPSAQIAKTAYVGAGSLCAARTVVAPDAKVGNHCIINHGAVVDHDCVVGDYSHIAPLSALGGAVVIGKGVLVGAGAIILPGIVVADYAVIGAGAVVTKHVAAGQTLVGNPAKLFK